MQMLDLHCHYLPGVDDGARHLQEGLTLVRSAVASGISRIVLTPHLHPGRYENTATSLRPRFEAFRRAVESARIPVQLALACEARLCDELLPLIERGEVPLLETSIGAKSLLLELPHSHVPAGCFAFIRWLQMRNIAPLLVHPERNKELMAHPQRLQKLRDAGCMVQITAAAVVGRFGARAQQTVESFLQRDWVDAVATDAHNTRYRPPLLREAALIIAQNYGEARARKLVDSFPAALTARNFSGGETNRCGDDSACNTAFDRMRAELLRRASEPSSHGAKAARILELMNSLQAR